MKTILRRPSVWLVAVLLVPAADARAKGLSAERYDVRAWLAADRSLTVEETVVFQMTEAPFTSAWREVRLGRVDGIVDVVAGMDGAVLPRGDGSGQVEVTYGRNLRVTWHFAPTTGRHEFSLSYKMLGVVSARRAGDRLAWVALPEAHSYRIGEATVALSWPEGLRLLGTPAVKPAAAAVTVGRTDLRIVAGPFGKNAVIRVDAGFVPGMLIAPPPMWQLEAEDQQRRGPWLLMVAAVALLAGFGWLAAFRAAWPRASSGELVSAAGVTAGPPRGDLPAAVAARLAGRGTRLQQIAATIVELAARGALRIEERPASGRIFGRSFDVHLVAEPSSLEPHEASVLDLLFGRPGHRRSPVAWRRVQQQANSKSWSFARALLGTMRRAGLVDEDRVAARRTLGRTAAAVGVLALATTVLAVVLLPAFGPWGFLVPAAVSVVAIGLAAGAGSFSILSRRGEHEAGRWKAFLVRLAQSARDKDEPLPVPPDWLPWATAAGVGHLAAKHLAGPVPAWFRAVGSGDDGAAFASFFHAAGSDETVSRPEG